MVWFYKNVVIQPAMSGAEVGFQVFICNLFGVVHYHQSCVLASSQVLLV